MTIFQKLLLTFGGLLLGVMIYIVLVPTLQRDGRSIQHSENAGAGASPVALPTSEPVPLPSPVTTTGSDQLAKVSVGDKGKHASMKVRSHAYRVVGSERELKELNNTISYVLLPRNLSEHTNQESAIYKRYVQVLEQIQELRKIPKVVKMSKLNRYRDVNKFILFKKGEGDERVTVENYNYELSYRILDFFHDKYPNEQFNQEGPYIITTAQNLLNGGEDYSFLYVSLSSFNNSAVRETIESYKARLVAKGNSDIQTLEAWRYALLSALTNFNADIHIVRSAVAGEL